MAQLTIRDAAAISRLAKILARLVTGGIIDAASKRGRLGAAGSNKHARLTDLLSNAWVAYRKREIESLIATLTMAAHDRHNAGSLVMTEADVDGVVGEMRALGLEPHDLAKKTWRKSLRDPSIGSSTSLAAAVPISPAGVRPTRFERELRHLADLLQPGVSPQYRGRQLELLLHGVLSAERLSPTGNIHNPGEEIDRGFSIEGRFFLVECKWEQEPIGFSPVRAFMAKVRRKAEGTFGVFLSMSGFVGDINEKAAVGERLNCVGIASADFMAVLEGRLTWSSVVRTALQEASNHSRFLRKAQVL